MTTETRTALFNNPPSGRACEAPDCSDPAVLEHGIDLCQHCADIEEEWSRERTPSVWCPVSGCHQPPIGAPENDPGVHCKAHAERDEGSPRLTGRLVTTEAEGTMREVWDGSLVDADGAVRWAHVSEIAECEIAHTITEASTDD